MARISTLIAGVVAGATGPTGPTGPTGATGASGATTTISNGTSNLNVASSGGEITANTAGSERMRIDSSGNVGIGTNYITAPLQVKVGTNNNFKVKLQGSTLNLSAENDAASAQVALMFNSGAAQIDSSGNLQIGTTSNPQSTRLTLKYGTSANWGVGPLSNGSVFYVINDGGSGVQLTSGNQAWAAQSDERVKTDLVPIENGLAKVATLRAVVGRLKNDESGRRLPFLIAQDVKAVLPEAVDTGEDEDATLSLRYSDVIPLLVASIKELKTLNDALTARIVALEQA